MPAPIQRSNLYYLFHCKSEDLSAKEQKKYKLYNIILGCFMPGIGHAICGIVYLIQKSCTKASKTNKVAQDKFNPQNNCPFTEKLQQCVTTFDKVSTLANLKEVNLMRVITNSPNIDSWNYPINGKKPLTDLLLKITSDANSLLASSPKDKSFFIFTLTSKAQEDGLETLVQTSLTFENGKLDKVIEPHVVKNNLKSPSGIDFQSFISQPMISTQDLIELAKKTPKTSKEFFPYMEKKIRECVDEFEKTLPLNEIAEIKFELNELNLETISFVEKAASIDKELMVKTIAEATKSKIKDLCGKGSNLLRVTLTSNIDNNRRLIVHAGLLANDGKYVGDSGPGVDYSEVNGEIPFDLLL